MTKRPLIWAFLPLFLGVFWVALGSVPAGASVIYSTNFENFEIGALNNQYGWQDLYGGWQVQTSYSHSGIKAISSTYVGRDFYRYFNQNITTGYVEFEYMSFGEIDNRLWLTDGAWLNFMIKNTGTENGVYIFGATYVKICDVPVNYVWTNIAIEWRPTNQARGRCGGGEWSNWITAQGFTYLNSIGAQKWGNAFYIDDFTIGTGSLPLPPVYSILISRPVDESIIPDFDNWLFNYEFYNGSAATTSLDFCTRIFPNTSTTTAWWYDCAVAWDIPGDSTTTRVFEMAKANPLWAGLTYSADVRLYTHFAPPVGGDLLATSDLISFTISTSSVGIFEGIPVATTTELVITCDPSDPFFQYSLCKLAAWLFVPSPTILNRFGDLKTAVQNKPPIGYFTAAKDILATLKNGTPTIEIAVLTGITNPIKDGLAWLFWFVFLFWLFNRIRHLDI